MKGAKMDNEQWFKDKLEQFKDDPEFIKEKILIEFGELKEKARKWDRVKDIATYEDKSCAGCPIETVVVCNEVCLCMQSIVDALEGESHE